LFAWVECFRVTLPSRQCRLIKRVRAFASFMCRTFGTTHLGGGGGGGGGGVEGELQ
jgi:hypothetical protein